MLEKLGINAIPGLAKAGSKDAVSGNGFGALLEEKLQDTINTQKSAEKTASKAVIGQSSMADLIHALNQAESSLNTMVAIRDRLVKAYEELMRMPI